MEDRALARRAALVWLAVLVVFAPAVGGAHIGASSHAVAASGVNVTATATSTPNETATPTPTPNGTTIPTPNETATPTPTPTPNETETSTPTPYETRIPTPRETPTPTPTPNGTTTPNETPNETPIPNETPTPPGMERDPIGWEGGFWHNDSLPIDRSDGLNRTELEAVVARTMARVEIIRQLEFNRTVPVRLRSRASYRRELDNRTVNESLRAFDNAKFEALFLVNETRDSIAVLRENAGSSTLGYYDPLNDSIVLLVDGAGDRNVSAGTPTATASSRNTSTPTASGRNATAGLLAGNATVRIDERTLAHELLHALQDQQFGLERYAGETRDEANALDALIEGDASLVERRYAHRCREAWAGTCLTRGAGDGGLANIGVYLVTYHPYSDGPAFVREFYRQGGWSAVNELYGDPPASTEQVIHPEAYPDDEPANVSLVDETAAGWDRVRPPGRPDYAELGEAAIAAGFVYPLYDSGGKIGLVPPDQFYNQTTDGGLSEFDPFDYDQAFSAGWDGDRLHVYRNDEGETGYVWRLVWDSPAEAREFYRGYQQLLAYWGATRIDEDTYRIQEGGFADAFHVRVNGSTVTIVNAPDVWALWEVRTGLAGEISPYSSTETMTVPGDARITVPGQPGFGPAVAVLALALFVRRRLRR